MFIWQRLIQSIVLFGLILNIGVHINVVNVKVTWHTVCDVKFSAQWAQTCMFVIMKHLKGI